MQVMLHYLSPLWQRGVGNRGNNGVLHGAPDVGPPLGACTKSMKPRKHAVEQEIKLQTY